MCPIYKYIFFFFKCLLNQNSLIYYVICVLIYNDQVEQKKRCYTNKFKFVLYYIIYIIFLYILYIIKAIVLDYIYISYIHIKAKYTRQKT